MSHIQNPSLSPAYCKRWAIVTVRIAWALMNQSKPINAHTLKSAREHALLSLPEHCSEQSAGRYAEAYLEEFLDRQAGRYQQHSFDDDIDIEIPLHWRTELEQQSSKTLKTLFRYCYARSRALSVVAKQKMMPLERLNRAQIELRRLIKKRAEVDGLDTRGWSDSRIDRLLTRTAQVPSPDYIEPEALLSSANKKQVMSCPIYRQASILIQQGALSIDDLIAKPLKIEEDTEILAIVLHPEGRKFQSQVAKAMGASSISTTQHEWLIDGEFSHVVEHNLGILTELNNPPRHLLRGALISGGARWEQNMLLGPLPSVALEAARGQAWGNIDGLAELPAALPPPPNARRWWMGTAAVAAVFILSIVYALSLSPSAIQYPINGSSEYHEGHVFLRFDVHNQAQLALIVFDGQRFSLERQIRAEEKANWSMGDGRYFTSVKGERILLISTSEPIKGLGPLFETAQAADYPMDTLQQLLRDTYPQNDIFVSENPPPAAALTYVDQNVPPE